jgi:hypothetical protein
MPTHLDQLPANHVVLELVGGMNGGFGPTNLDFVRILSDGHHAPAASPGSFRVPNGKYLVVTDVDWQYVHPQGATGAGKIQILRLFLHNLADPQGSAARVFESTVLLSSQGQGGISESMTTGFVVTTGTRIGIDVFPGPLGPPSGLQHAILRGYLTERHDVA